MDKLIRVHRPTLLFGAPILLIGFLVLLSRSLILANHPKTLSLAITVDLLFTVPLLYYLLIRKTKIPKTTVVPVLIIAVLIGSYGIPPENQHYLDLFKTWGLPFVEISVIAFVAVKVRESRKRYIKQKETSPDFFTAVKETCYEMLPEKIVFPFATEIAVIYYGFISWKTPAIKRNEFTYHKKDPDKRFAFSIRFRDLR